jgi:hypothetical protein
MAANLKQAVLRPPIRLKSRSGQGIAGFGDAQAGLNTLPHSHARFFMNFRI